MAGASVESVTSAAPTKQFAFRLAERADDAALRELLRETPMDGPVRVALCREPSYFDAAAIEGPLHQTLIAIDQHSGKVVAMGVRSVRNRYIEGQATPVGYLSGLRILPKYRGGTLLARGYREMRRLHEDCAAIFYLTTIADGNEQAAAALTRGRAGLPRYRPLQKYHTLVIPLRRRATSRMENLPDGLQVRPLRDEELTAYLEFVTEVGRSRSFFPCYAAPDFSGPQATFRGLAASDIWTAWRGSQLVACLGLWNQMGFKQNAVRGYRWDLRVGRFAFNPLARCLGWPRFPRSGQTLPAITAALPLAAARLAKMHVGCIPLAKVC